jgi:hypothetical protein
MLSRDPLLRHFEEKDPMLRCRKIVGSWGDGEPGATDVLREMLRIAPERVWLPSVMLWRTQSSADSESLNRLIGDIAAADQGDPLNRASAKYIRGNVAKDPMDAFTMRISALQICLIALDSPADRQIAGALACALLDELRPSTPSEWRMLFPIAVSCLRTVDSADGMSRLCFSVRDTEYAGARHRLSLDAAEIVVRPYSEDDRWWRPAAKRRRPEHAALYRAGFSHDKKHDRCSRWVAEMNDHDVAALVERIITDILHEPLDHRLEATRER